MNGCCLSIDSLALVLSTVSGSEETPLLEVGLLSLETSTRHADGVLLTHLNGRLLANVYTNTRLGWEPVLEPWTLGVQIELATRSASRFLFASSAYNCASAFLSQ